ncbi:MAG: Two-component system sensor histidine kinase [uncultured Nocardioidaceae bacterium]|uniref:histidine kinase n=1 Tax=uncultured Nocardioidaceae bacterium TaxID=253824 RepID=A0A6J4M4P1_9ACTN|nr:MAG: Two-component system sensor histidine kinase [uncultured Nocardioidaceae bacterium]
MPSLPLTAGTSTAVLETGGGVLDALPDGAILADAHGTVSHANEMARRLLRRDDLVGRPLAEAVALQDLDGRDWYTCTAPYSGPGIRTMQVEQAWLLSDGTELLVTTRMHRPGPHQPVEQVAVSLRSARARSRLDRERSDLVATVAHELRSPLTGVKGFTGTLLARWDKFNDEQKRLIMQSVHADTDRLTRLIAELLEVARIDTGRLSLHPRPIDPVPAVEQVTSSVRAGTGREIRFEPTGDFPQVLADPDRFAQVLTNLVDNAVRHGEGLVFVSAEPVTADGADFVRITVEDEGEGIAPGIRNRVFTKFWKHGSREGSGLGMYIAHGLVIAHGGRITIGDAAGGGASIEVLWPVFALLD